MEKYVPPVLTVRNVPCDWDIVTYSITLEMDETELIEEDPYY